MRDFTADAAITGCKIWKTKGIDKTLVKGMPQLPSLKCWWAMKLVS
jgi:hypothetical protein